MTTKTNISFSQEQLCGFRDVLAMLLGAIEQPKPDKTKSEAKQIDYTESDVPYISRKQKSYRLFKAMHEKGFLNCSQACEFLGISPSCLSQLSIKGKIAHVRMGRFPFYVKKDLEKYLSECFRVSS